MLAVDPSALLARLMAINFNILEAKPGGLAVVFIFTLTLAIILIISCPKSRKLYRQELVERLEADEMFVKDSRFGAWCGDTPQTYNMTRDQVCGPAGTDSIQSFGPGTGMFAPAPALGRAHNLAPVSFS
eukprot:gene12646-biopygen9928